MAKTEIGYLSPSHTWAQKLSGTVFCDCKAFKHKEVPQYKLVLGNNSAFGLPRIKRPPL